MSLKRDLGQIITFYSYKGGTGRTMALANTACLLAQSSNAPVLAIDWDLEAPGLHAYLEIVQSLSHRDDVNRENSQLGLIELWHEYIYYLENSPGDVSQFFDNLDWSIYTHQTQVNNLFFMPAGRMDNTYGERVIKIDWSNLFKLFPFIFKEFILAISSRFSYILVDSRTGLNDISGVCTSILPEKIVAVFTPNKQSLDGVLNIVESAVNYRAQSDDLRPITIFPLPSRIDLSEPQLLNDWRKGNEDENLIGYEKRFENLFNNLYSLHKCNLTSYFDEVQIQHVPQYAFGEHIAVLSESIANRLSIARSFANFSDHLIHLKAPWLANSGSMNNISQDNQIDVFVYSDWRNISEVQNFLEHLRIEGIRLWWDYDDLRAGESISYALNMAQAQASSYIVILNNNPTPYDIERISEINDIANKYSRPLIPVIFENAKEWLNDPIIKDRRAVFVDSSNFTDAIRQISRGLQNYKSNTKNGKPINQFLRKIWLVYSQLDTFKARAFDGALRLEKSRFRLVDSISIENSIEAYESERKISKINGSSCIVLLLSHHISVSKLNDILNDAKSIGIPTLAVLPKQIGDLASYILDTQLEWLIENKIPVLNWLGGPISAEIEALLRDMT